MNAWRGSSAGSGSGFKPDSRDVSETSEPAVQRGETDQLDAGGDTQLPVDARAVRLDGLDADEQLGGDALVAVSRDDEVEDLALARRQLPEQAVRLRALLRVAEQLRIEARRQVAEAARDHPDRRDDLIRGLFLQGVAARARGERPAHEGRIVDGGQDQRARAALPAAQLPRRGDPALAAEEQVHDRDIGMVLI